MHMFKQVVLVLGSLVVVGCGVAEEPQEEIASSTAGIWTCGLSCPAGWHPQRWYCDIHCGGPSACAIPGNVNASDCASDNVAQFNTCASCPSTHHAVMVSRSPQTCGKYIWLTTCVIN